MAKNKITLADFIEVDKWDKVDGKLMNTGERMVLPLTFFQGTPPEEVFKNLKAAGSHPKIIKQIKKL